MQTFTLIYTPLNPFPQFDKERVYNPETWPLNHAATDKNNNSIIIIIISQSSTYKNYNREHY
jgi:hypothetical protein